MSVFKKLAQARVDLQSVEMKKSGHNKFAGYNYFQLDDFLPHINNVFNKHGLCDVISIGAEYSAITIHDADSDNVIVFGTHMAEAPLKGALPIQQLGSQHTYIRRYLYMLALNIVEHDSIDAVDHVDPRDKGRFVEKFDPTDFESALESAADLKNLMDIWNTIPKEHQKALKAKAAEVKARLEKQ